MGKARRKNEKDVTSDDKVYLQEDFLQCLAVEMELGELVNLPTGVLIEEWIASNTVAFFEHINLIYGTISEFCTMSGCSEMSGPNKLYLWTDERGKRSKIPAPQYIDYVMTYMQKTLNDESIFPTKSDKDFPSTFDMFTRKIYRLLFHVLAHIYHMHFNEIVILDLHKHLNCIFAHLILFNQQFNLIDAKETEALNDLSIALKLIPDNQQEQMQITSSTPEPPTSLNLSNSIDQYLDTNLNNSKDSNELSNTHQLDLQNQHHLSNLQTSNSFNQEITQSTNQRKKHSRQHSYTASSQTVSSPTNYIKRFISSFSPNNQQQQQINSPTTSSTATTSLNQNSAINEDNSKQQTNIITTQFKSPFSIKNDEDNHLKDCDQENQKIILNNFNEQVQHLKKDLSTINKTHKYQNSTPIFFSSSFFSRKSNQDELNNQNENDVQLNDKLVIKENTKLLNSDQDQFTRRTTSASVYYLTQSTNQTSIFTTNLNENLNENSNENSNENLNENLNEDYSLDEQSTAMSFNQQTLDLTLEQSNQMDTRDNTEDDYETNNQFNQATSNRKFCSLEIDVNNVIDHNNDNLENNLTDNLNDNHRTSSNLQNVCAFND